MDINTIINQIPQLFTFIIPGYIAIAIKSHMHKESKNEDHSIIIESIILSYIINYTAKFIYVFINVITKFITNDKVYLSSNLINSYAKNISNKNILYNCLVILVSILISIILCRMKQNNSVNYLGKKLYKTNIEPYSSVWNYSLDQPNGCWARVYIDDIDIVYVGKLMKYTTNPNLTNKELYLKECSIYKISTGEELNDEEDMSVLIDATKIGRIEIIK
ncbi:hypothetical protein KQI36_14665 [Clostridium senegalense]|uniref:DUF6338 family protein n=1 Tax=Clostridium senegalense TaxID=1465809 RepID=UPI001C10E664|nr:DUF6338 family protein [Clostridium senegalense]MBU5227873.1 hypothetical protein [Clostridium senegalense]